MGKSSSFDEDWNPPKVKKSQRRKKKTSKFLDSDKTGTWSRQKSIESHHELSALSSGKQLKAPLLPVMYLVKDAFADSLV